jgi:methylenetetrahydrofolate reductase (NADPH)
MAAIAPAQALPLPAAVARIASFMADFSVETTRPSQADIAELSVLPRGVQIYVSAVPNRPAEESISAAVRLRAAGFEPVPHVAVRNFASATALDDFLARLNGEAEVRRALVIAGDRTECGPFKRAHDAIDSGVFRRRGIRSIGVAGYPDGHPKIGPDELQRALAEKIAAAEATGLAVEIVTQFCFDAKRMFDYVARLRAFGFEQPVRIGLAGPTSLSALLRYASRCGVRTSAQALAQRAGLVRQLFALTVPDDLIRALADAAPARVSAHFFSFGGLGATTRWARAVADGRITIEGDGGFRVVAPRQEG